jgi:hypothetical protein
MGKILSLALAFTSLFGGLAFYWNAGRIANFDWLIGMAVLAGTHFVFILLLIVALTMKFSRRTRRPFPMKTWLLIMLLGLVSGDTLVILSANINRARDLETQRRGDLILERARAYQIREKKFPQNVGDLGADILPPAIEGAKFEISGSNDQDFLVSYPSVSSVVCSKRLGPSSNWHCDE